MQFKEHLEYEIANVRDEVKTPFIFDLCFPKW